MYVFGMGDSTVRIVSHVHAGLSLFAELMSFVLFICRPVQPRASDINVWTAINLRRSCHESPHVSDSKAFSIQVTECVLLAFVSMVLVLKKYATFVKITVPHFLSKGVKLKVYNFIILTVILNRCETLSLPNGRAYIEDG